MLKAKDAVRDRFYNTKRGYQVYLYPNSRCPHACGQKTTEGGVPYRYGSQYGTIVHGFLPPNYELIDQESEGL